MFSCENETPLLELYTISCGQCWNPFHPAASTMESSSTVSVSSLNKNAVVSNNINVERTLDYTNSSGLVAIDPATSTLESSSTASVNSLNNNAVVSTNVNVERTLHYTNFYGPVTIDQVKDMDDCNIEYYDSTGSTKTVDSNTRSLGVVSPGSVGNSNISFVAAPIHDPSIPNVKTACFLSCLWRWREQFHGQSLALA